MTHVIEVDNLYKQLKGQSVLNGVNLTVQQHRVLGLLGVNGAGKTTLLRTALGLLKPDAGHARLYGHDAWNLPGQYKHRIGYVPQQPQLMDWMTAEQMLQFTGGFYAAWNHAHAEHLLHKWDLVGSTRVARMSVGQKQRLAIVLALGHNPDLLILDEPVAALDPVARREFVRQLIDLNATEGKTIVFSTHIVSDLERLAADVAIVKAGRVYFQGEIDELKEQVVKLNIQARHPLPKTFDVPELLSVNVTGTHASLCLRGFNPQVVTQLEQQFQAQVEVQPLGLEDIFLEVNR